jgi:head-tail adaptor
MKGIGGNTTATIQVSTTTKNTIGEQVKAWETVQTLRGWLDLSSGEARYRVYNAKVQESSHVFVCDYVDLDSRISAENARLIHNGAVYDITLIDNPMGLKSGSQLEIYLKYTGGQQHAGGI